MDPSAGASGLFRTAADLLDAERRPSAPNAPTTRGSRRGSGHARGGRSRFGTPGTRRGRRRGEVLAEVDRLPFTGLARTESRNGSGVRMGVVHLAERSDIGGLTAIKVLRTPRYRPIGERFAAEQRILAQLNHPSTLRSTTPTRSRKGPRGSSWSSSKACQSPSTATPMQPRSREACRSRRARPFSTPMDKR